MKKMVVVFGLLISSCSYIVILHDPLSAKEHVELGYTYESKKDYKDAIYQYKMAIKKDSHYQLAYYNLGNAYFKEHHYKKAIECYKKSYTLNPKNTDALNNIAYAYYKLGRYNKAKFFILKALKQKPNNKIYIDTLNTIEKRLNHN